MSTISNPQKESIQINSDSHLKDRTKGGVPKLIIDLPLYVYHKQPIQG